MTTSAKRFLVTTAVIAAGLTLALSGSAGANAAEKLEYESSEKNDSYYYPKVCSVKLVPDTTNALVVQCPPGHGFQKFKFSYVSLDYHFGRVDGIADCNVPADGNPYTFQVEVLPDDNFDNYTTRYEIIPLYSASAPTCPEA